MDDVTFILDDCVCGYHVCKHLWNATPGETLTCIRGWQNRNDVFAVAVQSNGNIVEHIYLGKFCVFVSFLYIEAEY